MPPVSHSVDDPLASGTAALARHDWAGARDHFRAAVAAGGSPEAWEGLSWAAWWLGDEGTTLDARERAYRGHRAAADPCGAARAALWLASDLLDFRGEDALAAGWLERAQRLLEDRPPCPEHGWLWLMQADLVLRTRADTAEVERLAGDARALGARLGVTDLEAVGLALQGITLVGRGEVEQGMRRLGEASAMAAGEEFDLPLSPGWTLCCVVSACEGIGDFPRADQWCRSMLESAEEWGGRNLMGVCRSVYGTVLAAGGDWPAAETVLMSAVDDLEASRPAMAASGLVRLGELRARQGRPEDARALFERAGAHPVALVGLGRLALRAGDARAAVEAAERVLRRLPEAVILDRLPGLELLARARAALGDLEGAAAAVEELSALGARLATPYLLGRVALVRAEVAAAQGEHDLARRCCEDAIDHLTAAAAPYEVALARVVLARALRALGRADAADAEEGTAREVFAGLGASGDAAGAAAAPEEPAGGPRRPDGELTLRELDVLALVAQGLGDAEIAERLVLSPHTVHRHVANIRTKLRAPSRSAAVAHAVRLGLL